MKKRRFGRQLRLLLLALCIGLGIITLKRNVTAATNYKYMIKVNKQQNCVTIYEKDEKGKYTVPVKAMVCSTGYATPLGTYKTMTRYRWKILLDNVWGQYSTRITGSILFHSVWYYKQDPSTLSATQYNKLGSTCSHGCIRLTVEDAKWIYENCPIGTTVTIYNSKDPGPLGKPKAQKLKAGTGWDPTDPDKANPFHNELPIISGIEDKTIEWGSEIDLLDGVSASSKKGNDLTAKIKVNGTVDTKKAGNYTIKYTVKDDLGNETKEKRKITVKECKNELRFEGIRERYVGLSQVIDETFCMEEVSLYFGKEELPSSQVKVSIKEKKDRYVVTYKAEHEGQEKALVKSVNFYFDTQPPILEVEHVLYPQKVPVNEEFVLQYVKVSDDLSDLTIDDVEVTIERVFEKGHLVTFVVRDEAGNETSETVQFTRTDCVRILGVKNHVVPAGTTVDEKYVMKGIEGLDGEKDATKKIKVTISEPEDHVYTVTYKLSDKYGTYTKIIAFFKEDLNVENQ